MGWRVEGKQPRILSGKRGPQFMIGHIAQVAKRLNGEAAKSAQLHLQLMSTCRKDRAELSVMMLAKRVIDSPTLLRKLKDPWPGWHMLRSQVSAAINRAVAA